METITFRVADTECGLRLDVLILRHADTVSRSRIQTAIKSGCAQVNGKSRKASYHVNAGENVTFAIPEPEPLSAQPENIPLEIIFEDADIIVVNKPAGLVVHPACGNRSGTLVNALLHHCASLSCLAGKLRPGIVHRLDKDTTGVLVVAKNNAAHRHLGEQFSEHSVARKYLALVFGEMDQQQGTIESRIGRDRSNRQRMSARPPRGRPAVTKWSLVQAFSGLSLVEASLETGRTHQVRVHFSSIGHPVVGDPLYCPVKAVRSLSDKKVQDALRGIKRQLLHARHLGFVHPASGQRLAFDASLPDDFELIVRLLRERS